MASPSQGSEISSEYSVAALIKARFASPANAPYCIHVKPVVAKSSLQFSLGGNRPHLGRDADALRPVNRETTVLNSAHSHIELIGQLPNGLNVRLRPSTSASRTYANAAYREPD